MCLISPFQPPTDGAGCTNPAPWTRGGIIASRSLISPSVVLGTDREHMAQEENDGVCGDPGMSLCCSITE